MVSENNFIYGWYESYEASCFIAHCNIYIIAKLYSNDRALTVSNVATSLLKIIPLAYHAGKTYGWEYNINCQAASSRINEANPANHC